MFYVILILVGYLSYFFGIFAFCQIIGSIRTRSHFAAVLVWTVLTVGAILLVYNFLNKYMIACAIGLCISFFKVLFLPHIE